MIIIVTSCRSNCFSFDIERGEKVYTYVQIICGEVTKELSCIDVMDHTRDEMKTQSQRKKEKEEECKTEEKEPFYQFSFFDLSMGEALHRCHQYTLKIISFLQIWTK